MASFGFNELQEKLLPQDSWRSNTRSFPGGQTSLPGRHFLPPLTEFEKSNSAQKQTEYLKSLTENVTDDYLQGALGKRTQSCMPLEQEDSILYAATSGEEFPKCYSTTSLNSSSGVFNSSSEMLPSSSMMSLGETTDILSYLEKPSFGHSQQPFVTTSGPAAAISNRDLNTSHEATKDLSISGHESIDLDGISPIDTGTINIQQYMRFHELDVTFCDLENQVFEKQQSRKDKKARQRIINGKVKFLVRSDRSVKDVRVWVRREAKAATLEKDANGMVPLEAVFLRKNDYNLEYQVDLDSVYDVVGSDRPVYKLAKVHVQERNKFELLVQVLFADNELSDLIKSKPFLIKTKRIHDDTAEPLPYSEEKRKRPNTCPSSTSRWSSQAKHQAKKLTQNEPDSTDSMSPVSLSSLGSSNSPFSSEGTSHLDQLVVKHLKAQQANIDKLSFGCMMQTSKGDIAYHLRLTNPDTYKTHEEGVVVGFFPDHEGMATIEPLSSENAQQAVMAGVISRSAYLEAHAPSDKELGQTDIVCVIGMVKVQIVGSVLTGERIYASTDEPGKAIPESHLPLGAFVIRHHTLLGMAMETCKSRRHGEVNLVKCFVCIVLGINSHQLAGAVENIVESIDMDIKVAIGKSNKTTCRRMFLLIGGLIFVLGVLGFFVYELLAPGSLFRYYLCQRGSRSEHHVRCKFSNGEEKLVVPFIQFDLVDLEEKIPAGITRPTHFDSNTAIFFLNYDRCAYGGRTDGSKYTLEKGKIVRGPAFLAADTQCFNISYLFEGVWKSSNDWRRKHANENLTCACSDAGVCLYQWILLLLCLSVYSWVILF